MVGRGLLDSGETEEVNDGTCVEASCGHCEILKTAAPVSMALAMFLRLRGGGPWAKGAMFLLLNGGF